MEDELMGSRRKGGLAASFAREKKADAAASAQQQLVEQRREYEAIIDDLEKKLDTREVLPASSPPTFAALEGLRLDGETQPRQAMDLELVQTYAERMLVDDSTGLVTDPEGTPWPVITVYDDGESRWLADGFHRVHAAKYAGLEELQANIIQGDQRDAILFSFGVNADHGKRRTRADTQRIMTRLLSDEVWASYTDAWLAEICKVSAPTIRAHRKKLEQTRQIPFYTILRSRDGREYEREAGVELDGAGFVSTSNEHEAASTPRREEAKPRPKKKAASREDVTGFERLGQLDAPVIIASPGSIEDYTLLASAITSAPELLIIPAPVGTSHMWRGPEALDLLVRGHDMSGPHIVYITSHQRFYHAWTSGEAPSPIVADAREILADRAPFFVGQPLGGWS